MWMLNGIPINNNEQIATKLFSLMWAVFDATFMDAGYIGMVAPLVFKFLIQDLRVWNSSITFVSDYPFNEFCLLGLPFSTSVWFQFQKHDKHNNINCFKLYWIRYTKNIVSNRFYKRTKPFKYIKGIFSFVLIFSKC